TNIYYVGAAEIYDYKKINPTLWKVSVNATEPFMLSFIEAYDPLWEAKIYKNGKLVGIMKSFPLYSFINGFLIKETGNLEILIRYKPQDWFELGFAISLTTFIVYMSYLIYEWEKSKGFLRAIIDSKLAKVKIKQPIFK
ncbi:MAG: hypothetical protein DRZ76_03165, partial [Candidatus Nealsonbacteria bacterium]